MLAYRTGGVDALKALRNLKCVPSSCPPFGGLSSVDALLTEIAKVSDFKAAGKIADEAFSGLSRVMADLGVHSNKAKGAVQVISRMTQLVDDGYVITKIEFEATIKNALGQPIGVRQIDLVAKKGDELPVDFEIKARAREYVLSSIKDSLKKNVQVDGKPPGQLFKDIVDVMRPGSTARKRWSYDIRAEGLEEQMKEAVLEAVADDPAVLTRLLKEAGWTDLSPDGVTRFMQKLESKLDGFFEVAPRRP